VATLLGANDRFGKQLCREVIAPLGYMDDCLTMSGAIQLRWSTRPRAGALSQATKLHLEPAVLDELVEMELRRMPRHPSAGSRLIPADPPVLRHDEAVQPASYLLGQGSEAVELSVEVVIR
jgi:hypothetical protein